VSGLQLFAVTSAHGHRALFGPRVEVVAFRDLAALVAVAPGADEGAGLRVYREVVESVFREQAVLPAPPGVIFRDRGVLAQWMELHYFTLLDALAYVEDRAVARVAVAVADPPPVADPPGADAGSGEPEARREASDAVLRDVLRVLRRHAVATLPIGGDAGRMAAASFLVERARWELFAEVVAEENDRLTGHALRLTGPWPPYDFVQMQFTN
jgi:hypothetical protein